MSGVSSSRTVLLHTVTSGQQRPGVIGSTIKSWHRPAQVPAGQIGIELAD